MTSPNDYLDETISDQSDSRECSSDSSADNEACSRDDVPPALRAPPREVPSPEDSSDENEQPEPVKREDAEVLLFYDVDQMDKQGQCDKTHYFRSVHLVRKPGAPSRIAKSPTMTIRIGNIVRSIQLVNLDLILSTGLALEARESSLGDQGDHKEQGIRKYSPGP
jgi:hypothetical protein